jgi:hypothetical protein
MFRACTFNYQKATSFGVPADATVRNVLLEGVQSNLDDLTASWPEVIVDGNIETITGLICENQSNLLVWAEYYWWKLNRHLEGNVEYFLMHHVDLYTFLGWNVTFRAADLSNFDWYGEFTGSGLYVDEINYQIDPGMGFWSGSIHVNSWYESGA